MIDQQSWKLDLPLLIKSKKNQLVKSHPLTGSSSFLFHAQKWKTSQDWNEWQFLPWQLLSPAMIEEL